LLTPAYSNASEKGKESGRGAQGGLLQDTPRSARQVAARGCACFQTSHPHTRYDSCLQILRRKCPSSLLSRNQKVGHFLAKVSCTLAGWPSNHSQLYLRSYVRRYAAAKSKHSPPCQRAVDFALAQSPSRKSYGIKQAARRPYLACTVCLLERSFFSLFYREGEERRCIKPSLALLWFR